MKQLLIWMQMITKRLFRKPLFLFTLLLIPLTVLLLRVSIQEQDSAMHILLHTDAPKDSLSGKIIEELLNSSGNMISFDRVSSKEDLENEILAGRADCGYSLPVDMEQAICEYEKKNTPFITAIYENGSFAPMLIQEMMYCSFYDQLCFAILDTYITDKTGQIATEELTTFYEGNKMEESFFDFAYADGSQNTILAEGNANYMLLPMRGIAAVFVLLAAMTGSIFWYDDHRHKLFCWLSHKHTQLISFLYTLLPSFFAGMVGLCSVYLSGSASSFGNECWCMGLYILATSAFCFLLTTILPKMILFLASIPLFVAGSLILSPVFISFASYNNGCRFLSRFTPVNYYLTSIHSVLGKKRLFLFFVIVLLAGIFIRVFHHFTTRNHYGLRGSLTKQ